MAALRIVREQFAFAGGPVAGSVILETVRSAFAVNPGQAVGAQKIAVGLHHSVGSFGQPVAGRIVGKVLLAWLAMVRRHGQAPLKIVGRLDPVSGTVVHFLGPPVGPLGKIGHQSRPETVTVPMASTGRSVRILSFCTITAVGPTATTT